MYCMEKLLKFTETHFSHLQSKDNNTSSHCCFEARWDDIYQLLPTMSECSVTSIRLIHQPWDENLLLSYLRTLQFNSVQSLSHVQLFATPWTSACQASLSITNSRSSLKLMSIELVMPSSHLILCHPLLLLPPIPPSIRVFSNGSALHMR